MKRIIVAAVVGFALSSAGVFAQEGGAPPTPKGGEGKGGKGPMMSQPIVTALDANSDGTIDADELAKAPTALKTLDKNADAKITSDEYRPARPGHDKSGAKKEEPTDGEKKEEPKAPEGRSGFKMPASPIVTALDANSDGTIDADELAKSAENLKKLDKNADGKISSDEYRPARPDFGGHKDGAKKEESKKEETK